MQNKELSGPNVNIAKAEKNYLKLTWVSDKNKAKEI